MTQSTSLKAILVVGANRGIGNQLATRFQNRGYQVFGTYRPQSRDDESVTRLKAQGIQTFELDYTDEKSINSAAKSYGQRPLDILINCGGIYHDWDNKRFYEQTADDLLEHFKINTVGPFLTSKAFFPAVSRSKSGKIINISSNMAGLANNYGGNVSYRVSKTAVNQLTKTMAVDLEKTRSHVVTLAVHPGWLATRMTGFHGGDDMDTCMEGLIETIERLGTDAIDGEETLESGSYVKWNGQRLAD